MKVASFNVRKFGREKLSDKFVRETLIKIVSRYDIIVILEVVDSSGDSVEKFLRELNQFYKKINYKMKISTRLGRGQYKEQFMFLYRDKVVDLVGPYQYEDNQPGDEDAFAREPYVLRFNCHNTELEDLVMIPVHTKPDDAEREIDELYDVFKAVQKKWGTKNIMILGDFNADGTYLSEAAKKKNRIWEEDFHWLIEDGVDTTASNNNRYTYDRIVVYGDDMRNAVVPNSAKSFNFQAAYSLTDTEALRVSDHYPVQVKLN
ncbi:deoxyribonuclease gamma-like [Sinocyclocheilus anshuiensis]|uniref:deoxyribonuclease gamma-like n=1 Tax=Sinocyclocheilus anshuiensis TaxID=1608454 RepID=UPI0007BAD17E|nr:PREDICTED: deoxyribonuclease gamma-like [Sinocyclocheilus anshuiensis]